MEDYKVDVRYRRLMDKEALSAGLALIPTACTLGQLTEDPLGWMTTHLWQFWLTADKLKIRTRKGTYPSQMSPGVMLPLWVHAAIWWALTDFGTATRWFAITNRRQWLGDASTRRVMHTVKPLLRRTQRYVWMAEVGLTYQMAGGPRDIAAILLKVAMMEGGQ